MLLAAALVSSGTLAYITPTSWEIGENYAEFRRNFFGHAHLDVLANLPYDVFDNPYVDNAVTVATLGPAAIERTSDSLL